MLGQERKLKLDCGVELGPVSNGLRDLRQTERGQEQRRARLPCADGETQFVAEPHPITGKPGWWEMIVGPGKPLDTDRFFIVCANVIGGCMGTVGAEGDQSRDRQILCP